MLGYVVPSVGAAPCFAEVPLPSVGPHDMLLKVMSSSINPVDGLVAAGYFSTVLDYRCPAVFGRDVCGRVEQVGCEVTTFAPDDIVWGFIKRPYIGDGAFAEYVAVPDDHFVVRVPVGLDPLDAGSLGLGSVTALECLDAIGLTAGQTVLINRATGSVGVFAVQIAVARGLRVIATARPGPATELVRSLGADDILDWTQGNLARQVRSLVPGGVDGLVDLVRRDAIAHADDDVSESQRQSSHFALSVLVSGGRFANANNNATAELVEQGRGYNVHSTPTQKSLAKINDMVSRGQLRVPVRATFGFDRIDEAFAHQRRYGAGKTALSVDLTA